jgi:hypothetical protein
MTITIRAIETIYRSYRFRSRLEARWAVFFDAAGIGFQYEAEGFNLDGTYYLPDFWLPRNKCFVEIKPKLPRQERSSQLKALQPLLARLAKQTDQSVFLLEGSPCPEDPSDCLLRSAPEEIPSVTGLAPGKGVCSARLFECAHCGQVAFRMMPRGPYEMWCECRGGPGKPFDDERYSFFELSPRIREAMRRARQARFEHGEVGESATLT